MRAFIVYGLSRIAIAINPMSDEAAKGLIIILTIAACMDFIEWIGKVYQQSKS